MATRRSPTFLIARLEAFLRSSPKQQALHQRYQGDPARANPDFQTEHGYPDSAPGKANLTMCDQPARRDASAASPMTLEMPFKDNDAAPDERTGWSPARCRKFGMARLDALHGVLDEL